MLDALKSHLDRWFVDGWRQSWRWWTIQLHAVATGLMALAYNSPTLMQDVTSHLPPGLLKPVFVNVALGVWLILGGLARLKAQPVPTPAAAPSVPPPGA